METVPTKLSPPEVAKKYAPGFDSAVNALRVGILLLGILLGAVGYEYWDEEVFILVIVLEIVLQILIMLNYALACLFFRVAVDKGYTSQAYLAAAFWLGAFGYLLIAALPNTYANVSVMQRPAQPVQYTQPVQPVQPQQVVRQTAPVQQTAPQPAPATTPANTQIGRCLQCGVADVPLHNVTVNISGVQRTRSVCKDCAAKYNQ